MGTSSIRILVVEDYEPWRQFLLSTLRNLCEPWDICEVSDGLEAVQEAQRLKPDLILLDIGLPTLNGFEAARQIRKLSPTSKIIFVSQESSADVVQEALDLGAFGYVVKTDAGGELLAAVTAALRGERFVGGRFAGRDFTGVANLRTADALSPNAVHASPSPSALRREEIAHRHEAHFYSDDESFLSDLTLFVGSALKAGSAAIVAACESRRDSLLPRLYSYGLDMGNAIEEGRYIALDAADGLSQFMLNGVPDPVRFMRLFDNLILKAAKAAKSNHPRVVIFGECVHLLWAQGNAEAAIQMEKLGNKLTTMHDVDILCGYSLGSVQGGMDDHIFQRICAEHSAVHSRSRLSKLGFGILRQEKG